MIVRAAGVTFENRQELLARIDAHPEQWSIGIVREPNNPHDPNALAIIARNPGGEKLHLGYISRELAYRWRKMDKFVITRWCVIGGGGRNYGLEMNVIPLPKVTRLDQYRHKRAVARR